jgi:mannose-6-phosphate isomerase
MHNYHTAMDTVERPWGDYSVLHFENFYQVKKLVVKPGNRISLQSHQLRAEHWFILAGQGTAELNGNEVALSPGDSIDIPIGAIHRISCTGESELVFIEIQTGCSFHEEDITRYADDYGRITNEC